jgi:LuxR family maltose regulon positive regulatory protein
MLHQAAAYYGHMLTEAKQEEDLNDIAHAQLGLAQLFYEWNRLEEAWGAAQEANEIGKRLAHEELQALAVLVLARVECARGQTASAQQRTASLLAWMQPQRKPFLFRAALAWQIRLQLAVGNCSAVQHWVSSRNQPKETLMLRQQEEEELLLARWLLTQGEETKALERLVSLLTPAQEAGRTRSVLEIQMLITLAHIARKQRREARNQLQAVLVLAQSENYLRLFLDEGEVIITHLRALLPALHKQPLRMYLQAILQAEARGHAGQYSSPAPDALSHIELLSAQELRVLRLLATGRSNPEIAHELIVSVNTIRTQVQSIYRKLGVNNRVAASDIARHLQLA